MDKTSPINSLDELPEEVRALLPVGTALEEPLPEQNSSFQHLMLQGIQNMPLHGLYAGTANPATVQERRTRNKNARKSRRINRKRK